MRRRSCALLLLLGSFLVLARPVRADEGTIAVGGEFLFRIRAAAEGKTVEQRVNQVEERLVTILAEPNLRPADVKFTPISGGKVRLTVKNHFLINATPEDGKANHVSALEQAKSWVKQLKKALPRLNAQPNPNDQNG